MPTYLNEEKVKRLNLNLLLLFFCRIHFREFIAKVTPNKNNSKKNQHMQQSNNFYLFYQLLSIFIQLKATNLSHQLTVIIRDSDTTTTNNNNNNNNNNNTEISKITHRSPKNVLQNMSVESQWTDFVLFQT